MAIARALANRPGVILADEPTASLDSRLGRQVMELFAQVAHDQGAGVIVVTHDHRALDLFDTIFEMEDGTIRQQRQPQDMPVTEGVGDKRCPTVAQAVPSAKAPELSGD